MSVSKYEAFARVVELGSLTRAAEELGCTQSAVSHTISALEEELGFPVLTRSRAGVKLTADGERVLPAVRGVLNSQEQLSQIASSIRGLDCGTVRIGTFTSVAVHWLPSIIKEFQRDYPSVDIKLSSPVPVILSAAKNLIPRPSGRPQGSPLRSYSAALPPLLKGTPGWLLLPLRGNSPSGGPPAGGGGIHSRLTRGESSSQP
jgi:DNA-binding transcriptional LysR family regulator